MSAFALMLWTATRESLLIKLLSLLFGILSFGAVFGAYSLGMFVPCASSRGCIVGMMSAFALMLWIGFGQMRAMNNGTYGSTGAWAVPKETSSENCPATWNNNDFNAKEGQNQDLDILATAATAPLESNFNHLPIYEVSYLWFTSIGFFTVLIVGTLVSCCFPRDIRSLDRRLISKPFLMLAKQIFPKGTGVGAKVDEYR